MKNLILALLVLGVVSCGKSDKPCCPADPNPAPAPQVQPEPQPTPSSPTPVPQPQPTPPAPTPTPQPSPTPSPTPTPMPPQVVLKAQVLVFATPWCPYCHDLIKALDPKLKKYQAGTVASVVMVGTGNSKTQPPNDADNASFKSDMGSNYMDYKSDPWKFQTYKKYLGNSVAFPGAVILDGNGNVVRPLNPGSFDESDIVAELDKLVK